MSYDLNGRHEVLGSRYYSGPFDSVGIQYTIRTLQGQSDEYTVEKIENFFKSNAQVVTTPPTNE